MMVRKGFTLIEVTIAIVITGVVALLAYGSVQAGLDSGDRIAAHREEAESSALLRSLVVDALRHPASAPGRTASSFTVASGAGGGGVNDHRLQFVSRGVSPPHGAGALWNVVLEPTPQGLRLSASPLEPTPERAILSTVSSISGMKVRVMAAGADAGWVSEWQSPNIAPHAVEVRFFDRENREVGVPTVVVTSMEGGSAGI